MNELSSSLFVRSINPTKIPCCFRSAELGVLKQKSVERMAEGGKNKSEIEKRERKEREREREREGGGEKGNLMEKQHASTELPSSEAFSWRRHS